MIFTGLRLSLQASWTTLVAAELVGSLAGLGYVLNVAQQDLYPGMILVGMAAVGVLGAGSTALLGLVERTPSAGHRSGERRVMPIANLSPVSRTLALGTAGTALFLASWAGLAASGLVLHAFLPSAARRSRSASSPC